MVHLKYILPAAAALLVSITLTAETPSWIRKNAISPDGKTLAFSYKGDIVLDPFNGAGTTTAVAKKINRRYIGIDISTAYCNTAKKRLDETT